MVEHTRHLGNWALRIKNARKDDEGIYECQLSTHPPESIFIELRIVGELEFFRPVELVVFCVLFFCAAQLKFCVSAA